MEFSLTYHQFLLRINNLLFSSANTNFSFYNLRLDLFGTLKFLAQIKLLFR